MAILGALIFLVIFLAFIAFLAFIWCKIAGKMGYHWSMGLLFLVPLVGFIAIIVLAFNEWPIEKQLREAGLRSDPKPTNTVIIVLIALGAVFLLIVPLLAAIAIPNLLRASMSSNEALAKATLRAISTAAESYATANSGVYPDGVYELTTANPPYLNNHYCNEQIAGYSYTCTFDKTGYKIIATPLTMGSSGSAEYTITTGGVMSPGSDSQNR